MTRYHVVAVQDWGGSQEYWCGRNDQGSREDAGAFETGAGPEFAARRVRE